MDLIDRQKAIEMIRNDMKLHHDYLSGEYRKALGMAVNALEAQQWIPCSERLPEPRIDVWCNSDMGQMVGYYEENVETWYGRNYLELMVTAWMPLPEPFKAERWEDGKTT